MIPTTDQSNHLTQSFTEIDSLDLAMWAESCFYLYGKAVPLAQALYNQIYNTTVFFSEDCPEYLPKSVSLNTRTEDPLDVLLFPNPNSNVLYGKTNKEDLHSAHCVIRSTDGKLLFEGNFHFLRGLNLNNIGLVSGVYNIEMSFEDSEDRIVRKLVFVK